MPAKMQPQAACSIRRQPARLEAARMQAVLAGPVGAQRRVELMAAGVPGVVPELWLAASGALRALAMSWQ